MQQGISGQIRTPRYKTNIDDLPDPAKVLMEFKPYKLGTLADPKAEADRLERIALSRLSSKNATEADIQEAYAIKADATFARAIAQLQDSRKALTIAEIDRITQGFAVSISQTNGLNGTYDGQGNFIDPSDKNTGTLINGVYSVCRHGDPAFPDIFTGREEWFVPSESEIKSAMRHYFSENQTGLLPTIPIDLKFSYNAIGDRIKDLLNE